MLDSDNDRSRVLTTLAEYAGALFVALAAVLLRWSMAPWMGLRMPFGMAFGAVAVAVWLGGWGPAVLSALIGFIAGTLLFIAPVGSLAIADTGDVIGVVMYCVSCLVIIGLGEALRSARDRHRLSEERFRGSQEASLQGFALLKAVRDRDAGIVDFVIQYVNPRGAAMAGGKPADFIGRTLLERMPGIGSRGLFSALVRVVETGEASDDEGRHDPETPARWFRAMAVKVGDGVAMSYFDVTDRRRLENALTERAVELQRADANKSQFLAILSHELRNPLAPLRNGLTLLQMKNDPRTFAEVHAMMERQIGHLTRLIDDLLDVSRIDRGRLRLQRERVAIETIVLGGIETAKPVIEARSHELLVRYAKRPLHVDADRTRMTQVVANLLINAAKFTPAGGRIEVSMGTDAEEAVVTVRDNGIGLAHEHLGLIFEMFVQLDSSKTQTSGGLGLGLTLVRSIIEHHGGKVEAHSGGPGRGSEFSFRLPLAAALADREEEQAVAERKEVVTPRRILVVDDNVDAARSLADLLRIDGHDVKTSFDGNDAFRLAGGFRPQLAFVDLNMPGMDGVELARRLRAEPWGRNILLTALTGLGQPVDLERTREAGFQRHMTKPASPQEVLRLAASAELQNIVPFKRNGRAADDAQPL